MRAITVLMMIAGVCCAQVAQEANREYATPQDRAKLVERLEAPARLARVRPAQLVERLEVAPGSTVVDLGSGTGMLLEPLSRAVGAKGRVIAEDIHSDFQEHAKQRAAAAGLKNVEFILGTDRDPKLPAGAADLVIVLDAYHHFDYPEQMLAAIHKSLRPGGRLAIVEYHKKRGAMETADPDFAIQHVRAASEQVEKEVAAAGYRLLWMREHAPGSQYIAMFERPR